MSVEDKGKHNPAEGGPCFVHATKEWIAKMLTTPEQIRTLPRKLYCKAEQVAGFVRANRESAGIDQNL